jgi:type VI secretion system lysozyme-like protein
VVGPGELRAAVGRDLARLLNTRSPVAWTDWSDRERTVLDYGIPDFSALHPANGDDRMRLGAMVEQCIATFEPRLRSVRVHVQPRDGSDPRTLMLRIDALLAVGDIREPVSFPVILRERGDAIVEVIGDE